MKRFAYPAMIIIFLVAIIIYAVCTETKAVIIIPIIIIGIIVCAFLIARGKGPDDNLIEEEPQQKTLQYLIDSYGSPDEIIVTDVTRGNEIDGAVLVYKNGGRHGKGFLVYNGYEIDMESITDITFHNNFGTAFGLPDEFQVVITTNDENLPKIYIRAGNDIEMVKDIVTQMKSLLTI